MKLQLPGPAPFCKPQARACFYPPLAKALRRVSAAPVLTEMAQTTEAETPSIPLTPDDDSVWYFAFGSNMNPKTLSGRRKVDPRRSEPCEVPGYGLSFSHKGFPFAEPGFATILNITDPRIACVRDEGPRAVQGVVHLISKRDWLQIQRTEGVGSSFVGYQVVEVNCRLYDGQEVKAYTLMTHHNTLGAPGQTVLPSLRYRTLLVDGAKHHNLAPDYREYLESLEYYDPERLSKRVGKYVMLGCILLLASPFLPFMIPYRMMAMRFYKDKQAPGWWVQAYIFYLVATAAWAMHNGVLSPLLGSGRCNDGGWGPVKRVGVLEEGEVKGERVAGATAELQMQAIKKGE